jgi:hypothetical protein
MRLPAQARSCEKYHGTILLRTAIHPRVADKLKAEGYSVTIRDFLSDHQSGDRVDS